MKGDGITDKQTDGRHNEMPLADLSCRRHKNIAPIFCYHMHFITQTKYAWPVHCNGTCTSPEIP